VKANPKHNLPILPWISPLLAVIAWYLAAEPHPAGPVPLITTGLLLVIWLIIGIDARQPLMLLEQAGAMVMIIGCTFELMQEFPERVPAFIVMGGVVWWLAGRQIKHHRNAVGWLILTLGLTTAPFTELHLDRNLWTLSACLMSALYTIQSKRFLTSVSRRIYLALAAWMMFCLLTLLSAFWSVYPNMSVRHTGILVFDAVIFVLAATIISDAVERKLFTTALLCFAGVYLVGAGWALFERVVNLGFSSAFGFRIYIFERHPNYTIFYLLMMLPLWFLPMERNRPRPTLAAAAGLLGSCMYLVFFSFSRQSYIVLVLYAAAALFMIREPLTRRLIRFLIIAGAAVSGISIIVNPGIRQRILSIAEVGQSLRFNAWKVFGDLIIERPVLGYGLGTNRYIYPRALGFIRPGEVPTRQFLFEAHNAYIDVLTGLGIAGLIVFVLFLAVCTVPLRKPRLSGERIAVFIGLAVWIDLFFNYRLHVQDTGSFLMVLLAYTVVFNSPPGDRYRIRIPVHPGFQTAMTIILIIFCAVPWLANAQVKTAQRLLETRDWPKILNVFRRASLMEPLNAHPHYYMALCHQQMQQPEAANNEFRTAVNLCPNYSFYRFHLAMSFGELRDFEASMQQMEAARNLEPYDPDGRIRFNLGVLEWRLGHYRAAREDLWTAIMLNPEYINDAYWTVNPGLKKEIIRDLVIFSGMFQCSSGYVLHQRLPFLLKAVNALKETEEEGDFARRALLTAAWTYPGSPDTVIAAVLDLVRSRRPGEAERLIYQSLALNPDRAVMYNYLGYVYLNQDRYDMVRFCVSKSSELWSEISIDNYFGYQLHAEAARHSLDLRTFRRLEPKLEFLGHGRYARQAGDLSIHIGQDNYLVNAPNLRR